MALVTLGKLNQDGTKHSYNSIRRGKEAWSKSKLPIYLISKRKKEFDFDFWVVEGTIYYGFWQIQSWMTNVIDLTTK